MAIKNSKQNADLKTQCINKNKLKFNLCIHFQLFKQLLLSIKIVMLAKERPIFYYFYSLSFKTTMPLRLPIKHDYILIHSK